MSRIQACSLTGSPARVAMSVPCEELGTEFARSAAIAEVHACNIGSSQAAFLVDIAQLLMLILEWRALK